MALRKTRKEADVTPPPNLVRQDATSPAPNADAAAKKTKAEPQKAKSSKKTSQPAESTVKATKSAAKKGSAEKKGPSAKPSKTASGKATVRAVSKAPVKKISAAAPKSLPVAPAKATKEKSLQAEESSKAKPAKKSKRAESTELKPEKELKKAARAAKTSAKENPKPEKSPKAKASPAKSGADDKSARLPARLGTAIARAGAAATKEAAEKPATKKKATPTEKASAAKAAPVVKSAAKTTAGSAAKKSAKATEPPPSGAVLARLSSSIRKAAEVAASGSTESVTAPAPQGESAVGKPKSDARPAIPMRVELPKKLGTPGKPTTAKASKSPKKENVSPTAGAGSKPGADIKPVPSTAKKGGGKSGGTSQSTKPRKPVDRAILTPRLTARRVADPQRIASASASHSPAAANPEIGTVHFAADPPRKDLRSNFTEAFTQEQDPSRLVLMPRDPEWLYAYWEINPADRQAHRIGELRGAPILLLRMLALPAFEGEGDPISTIDLVIVPDAGNWMIQVPRIERDWAAQLGYIGSTGEFIVICRSNRVAVPYIEQSAAPPEDEDWEDDAEEMAVAVVEAPREWFEPGISGAGELAPLDLLQSWAPPQGLDWTAPLHQMHKPDSPPVARLIPIEVYLEQYARELERDSESLGAAPGFIDSRAEDRETWERTETIWAGGASEQHLLQIGMGQRAPLAQQPASVPMPELGAAPGSMLGAAIGVAGQPPQEVEARAKPAKNFWLRVHCDLIVYGATEPNARVTVQGMPIELRADGTFSLRYALPDGTQVIPVRAVNADGDMEREITPTVERRTEGEND